MAAHQNRKSVQKYRKIFQSDLIYMYVSLYANINYNNKKGIMLMNVSLRNICHNHLTFILE